jgi:hypothetical protein
MDRCAFSGPEMDKRHLPVATGEKVGLDIGSSIGGSLPDHVCKLCAVRLTL